MDFLEFYNAFKTALKQQNLLSELFLTDQLNMLKDSKLAETAKMTGLSILFEGFYSHLKESNLKHSLLSIRTARWNKHFGTPTIPFLLTYQKQIQQTKNLFDEFPDAKKITHFPWIIQGIPNFTKDDRNNVLIDKKSILKIIAPSPEKTGFFTKTHNPMGGFTTTPCDPISQEFIAQAAKIAQKNGKILEIGAAFGAATLAAIANGASVFCNDINPENLAVIHNRHIGKNVITGDDNKLVLVPGKFPDELAGLPEKHFDAILICRVLHFFTGKKIEESLAFLSKLLVPGGKLYIVCETPYLKNWQKFLPEFNKRIEQGTEWPGEISNPADFESSGRSESLPEFVHWITKDVLERSLKRAGFLVEHAEYINRKGQFPEDLLIPEIGKESIGAIGICRSNT